MSRTSQKLLADAAACQHGQWIKITIRDLLNAWGFQVRNPDSVLRIESDLARAGFSTEPSFTSGPSDSVVRLVPAPAGDKLPAKVDDIPRGSTDTREGTSPEPDSDLTEEESSEFRFPEASLRVGDMPSATGGVVGVLPSDSLEMAHTLMMKHDFSQLPVLSDARTLSGAVSWESIARAQVSGKKAISVSDVADPKPEVIRSDDDLLEMLPRIVGAGYSFVRNENDVVCGIVTTADLSEQYDRLARPYFLIGDIERRLRRHIARCFTADEIRALGRRIESVDDLTMGNYCRLLEKQENWSRLGWALDNTIFVRDLDKVRETRNEIMHFRPDPLGDEQVNHLVTFASWLHLLDP